MKLTGTLAEKGLHAFDAEPRHHAGHEIPRIWIVVADRQQAHVFRKTKDGVERIADAKTTSLRQSHEETGGSDHHGDDVKSAKLHHGDTVFTHQLAAWLGQAEHENAFDRLVLVAAPRTLGDLRDALAPAVYRRISAEIDKELTEMPDPEIKNRLSNIIWF